MKYHYKTRGLFSETANLPGGNPFNHIFNSFTCDGCIGCATLAPSAIYVIVIISLRLSDKFAEVWCTVLP